MKKVVFVFAAIFTAQLASAGEPVFEFKCETAKAMDKGHKTTKFAFAATKLQSSKVSYWTKDEGDYEPVHMTPKNSILMLNDNYGIDQGKNGIVLTSDGDGCQWTTVVLYEDSGYRSGYAQVKSGGCGAKDAYSPVKCSVSEK